MIVGLVNKQGFDYVIKLGSNITTREDGKFNSKVLENICQDIVKLKEQGKKIGLVVSGAKSLGDSNKLKGQQILLDNLQKIFNFYGTNIQEYWIDKNNFKRTMDRLSDTSKRIAIFNETPTEDDSGYINNDILGGCISIATNASKYVMLTNVDGVFKNFKKGELMSLITHYEDAKKYLNKDSISSFGTGGMGTKLDIAECLSKFNIFTIIANGKRKDKLLNIHKGNFIGTLCYSRNFNQK